MSFDVTLDTKYLVEFETARASPIGTKRHAESELIGPHSHFERPENEQFMASVLNQRICGSYI